MAKRKYYPNNWEAFATQPDKFFMPISYDEFYKWKIMGWMLPSSISCIIREERDGKIYEKIYSRSKSAKKYLDTQVKTKGTKSVFTICDNHSVQVLRPAKKKDDEYVVFEDDEWIDDEYLFDEETGHYED
tara:strand:+ start:791 stop:1180 length:390 start_codon:yes stop_codon:yes gene_type:complete